MKQEAIIETYVNGRLGSVARARFVELGRTASLRAHELVRESLCLRKMFCSEAWAENFEDPCIRPTLEVPQKGDQGDGAGAA